MWYVTLLVTYGKFGGVLCISEYLSSICLYYGSIVCFSVTGISLQPRNKVTQRDDLVFLSTNLCSRVPMSILWCYSRSIPMINIETSAKMKIKSMGVREPTLKYTYRLPYTAIGFPSTACKLKTAPFSWSFEYAGRMLTSEAESMGYRTLVVTSAVHMRWLCPPAKVAVNTCRMRSFTKRSVCLELQKVKKFLQSWDFCNVCDISTNLGYLLWSRDRWFSWSTSLRSLGASTVMKNAKVMCQSMTEFHNVIYCRSRFLFRWIDRGTMVFRDHRNSVGICSHFKWNKHGLHLLMKLRQEELLKRALTKVSLTNDFSRQ